MGNIVMWALLTGGITGGVWVSIVLLANHSGLRDEQRQLGDALEAKRQELARVEERLAAMEARHAELERHLVRVRHLGSPSADQ